MSSKPAGNRIHSFISKWYLSEKISLSSQGKLTRSKMSKIEKNKKQIYTISTVAALIWLKVEISKMKTQNLRKKFNTDRDTHSSFT